MPSCVHLHTSRHCLHHFLTLPLPDAVPPSALCVTGKGNLCCSQLATDYVCQDGNPLDECCPDSKKSGHGLHYSVQIRMAASRRLRFTSGISWHHPSNLTWHVFLNVLLRPADRWDSVARKCCPLVNASESTVPMGLSFVVWVRARACSHMVTALLISRCRCRTLLQGCARLALPPLSVARTAAGRPRPASTRTTTVASKSAASMASWQQQWSGCCRHACAPETLAASKERLPPGFCSIPRMQTRWCVTDSAARQATATPVSRRHRRRAALRTVSSSQCVSRRVAALPWQCSFWPPCRLPSAP